MKFKAAIITLLTLLVVYFPLTFMFALIGHAATWNGSKEVILRIRTPFYLSQKDKESS
jgi:hypothetical protein